jgi:hypothetical protein
MTTPEDESASPRIEPPAEAVEVVARAIYDAPGPDGDHLAAYFSDNFRISATNVVELRAEILNICRCAAREAIEAYEAWRRSPDTRGEKHMTTPEEERIFIEAKAHGNRYLLRRRFRRFGVTTEWNAAEALVMSGHARWIPNYSNYAPGIELTGKPLDTRGEANP